MDFHHLCSVYIHCSRSTEARGIRLNAVWLSVTVHILIEGEREENRPRAPLHYDLKASLALLNTALCHRYSCYHLSLKTFVQRSKARSVP